MSKLMGGGCSCFSEINCIFRFIWLSVEVDLCWKEGEGRKIGWGGGYQGYNTKEKTIMFQREIIATVSLNPTHRYLLV